MVEEAAPPSPRMGGSLNPQCTPVNVIDTIHRSRLVTEKGEHRLRWDVFHDDDRPARVEDVHELALAMPYVTVECRSTTVVATSPIPIAAVSP
jgi:hypothetical protein